MYIVYVGYLFKQPTYLGFWREKSKHISPYGNRTQVSRVTGGDTDHYTNEDGLRQKLIIYEPISSMNTEEITIPSVMNYLYP